MPSTPNFAPEIPMPKPLLELSELSIGFTTGHRSIRPVHDVCLSIYPGQTVALVGESGCGKSVTALSILRLIPSPPGHVLGGRVLFEGRDLLALSEREMQQVRGKDIAMIFQEPMTSLNPVFTIGEQIVEAVTLHQHVGRNEAYAIAEKSMRDVGIADPHRRLLDYPHQLSGGMRQRVMIAMALSCQPKLLIADEPTTALDVTIQAQILELLRSLQQERGMSILLITHDLGVVAENADVAAVMYASRIVEHANVGELFENPQHPYTQGLFRAVPRLGVKASRLVAIPGTVPNPGRFPPGCKFHPRCALAASRASAAGAVQGVEVATDTGTVCVPKQCHATEPDLRETSREHWAACHYVAGYAKATATVPRSASQRATEVPLPVIPMAMGEGGAP